MFFASSFHQAAYTYADYYNYNNGYDDDLALAMALSLSQKEYDALNVPMDVEDDDLYPDYYYLSMNRGYSEDEVFAQALQNSMQENYAIPNQNYNNADLTVMVPSDQGWIRRPAFVHRVPGDGDCGFTALGITRQWYVNFLKSLIRTEDQNIIHDIDLLLISHKFYNLEQYALNDYLNAIERIYTWNREYLSHPDICILSKYHFRNPIVVYQENYYGAYSNLIPYMSIQGGHDYNDFGYNPDTIYLLHNGTNSGLGHFNKLIVPVLT